jgi:hypothetical protein
MLRGATRGLIGDSDQFHEVVVRVDDVPAALRVNRLLHEVEQVAVRHGRNAGDAQVADVAAGAWRSPRFAREEEDEQFALKLLS